MSASLLRFLGFVFLGAAVLGIFLPLLPTTPLVLLATACFARSSEKWHQWMIANRTFGPMISNWERHRCVKRRVKLIAILSMLLVGGYSILFAINQPAIQVMGGLLIAIGLVTVSRLKTCNPDDEKAESLNLSSAPSIQNLPPEEKDS